MKLWIRTQDRKRIIEINNISCSVRKQTVNKPDALGTITRETFSEYFVINGGLVLGQYDSEERCIEIIDEVQGVIEKGKNSETTFYEMPEA